MSPEGCGEGAEFCFLASYLDAPCCPAPWDRCSRKMVWPAWLSISAPVPMGPTLLVSGKWYPVTLTSPYSESGLRAFGPSLKTGDVWSAKSSPSRPVGALYPTRNFPLTEHCQKISTNTTPFLHWVVNMCQVPRYVLYLNVIPQLLSNDEDIIIIPFYRYGK